MPPLVSICLPNLNTRPFLEERMESLRSQTLADWELIISDNYSDDGSWEFFQKFADDPRLILFQSPRAGMYANWNNCLRRAVGEYVYIATSDDSCRPTLLEKTVALLERHPDVDLCVCAYEETDAASRVLTPYIEPETEFLGDWLARRHRRNRLAEFLIDMCLGCHWKTITAVVFRRRLLEKTGLFWIDCLSYADTPWRVKAILNSDLLYIPEPLATWRQHAAQATAHLPANREELVFKAIRRAVYESAHLLPAAWQSPGDEHLEAILLGRRRRYYQEFHLHRNALRYQPRDFARGVLAAARKEPRFLLQRVCERFSWDSEWYGDMNAYLLGLLDKWRVPWPPTFVEG